MKTRISNSVYVSMSHEECRDAAPTTRSFLRSTLKQVRAITVLGLAIGLAVLQSGYATGGGGLSPEEAAQLDADATTALRQLYAKTPVAKDLGGKARAILIFPDILKAGFMIGGQHGNGVLRQKGRTVGYYETVAASYGLQAGVQNFGYALFLMSPAAVEHLHDASGWELGTGPSMVLVDEGMAKSLSTTTLRDDIYAFVFNQTGLMAGAGLQGSKITEIHK